MSESMRDSIPVGSLSALQFKSSLVLMRLRGVGIKQASLSGDNPSGE
jgi:hypothetical protein